MKEVGVSDPVWISHAKMDSLIFEGGSIEIDAVIKSKSGIADATLYWATDTTLGFNPSSMQFVSGDSAMGFIPPQMDSTIIYYYISATSNSGRTVTKPLVAPAGFYKFMVENSVTGAADISQPEEFCLFQNYPNPFNPSTKIKFTIPSNVIVSGAKQSHFVTLKVFDILGNEVATLVNEEKPAGIYEVEFSRNLINQVLTSGIYFYQLKVGSFIETKKMILLK